jgi:hypothetical protein
MTTSKVGFHSDDLVPPGTSSLARGEIVRVDAAGAIHPRSSTDAESG